MLLNMLLTKHSFPRNIRQLPSSATVSMLAIVVTLAPIKECIIKAELVTPPFIISFGTVKKAYENVINMLPKIIFITSFTIYTFFTIYFIYLYFITL